MVTRRTLIASIGVGAGGGLALALAPRPFDGSGDGDGRAEGVELSDSERSTFLAVAAVVSPSAVTVTPEVIERTVARLDPDRASTLRTTLRQLDGRSRAVLGSDLASATPRERESLLRELGVDSTFPTPDGTLAGRVRYHVVNGLLYELFSAPIGSTLFGIDNPRGYPGGYYGSDQYPVPR